MPTDNRRRVLASQVKVKPTSVCDATKPAAGQTSPSALEYGGLKHTHNANDHPKKKARPASGDNTRSNPSSSSHARDVPIGPLKMPQSRRVVPTRAQPIPTEPRNMRKPVRDDPNVFSPRLQLVNGRLPPDPMHYIWRHWPNLKILIKLTHRDLEVRDIFDIFSQFGFIGRIDVNKTNASATVLFVPPPADPFWLTGIVKVKGRSTPLRIGLLRNLASTEPSPLNANVKFPSFLNVPAYELAFGVKTGETQMMQMLTLGSHMSSDILMQLNLRKKELDIRFQFPTNAIGNFADLGRCRVPLRDLKEAICVDKGEHCAFVFTLQTPPEFYKQLEFQEMDFDTNPWNEWSSWNRQTELVHPDYAKEHYESPLRMHVEHAVIDYGRWLSYRFIVSKSSQFNYMLDILRDFNVRIKHVEYDGFTFLARKDATIWDHLELPSTHPSIKGTEYMDYKSRSGMHEMRSGISHLPFPVLWQLMVCISHGFLNEFNMTEEFLQKLDEVGPAIAQGLLERIADCKLRFHDPMQIFSQVKVSTKAKRIPSHCSLLYACSVTPTTIVFSSPVVEISNRVMRKNSEYQDRFLRVRFTEENTGRIHSQRNSVNEELFVRIRRFLKHGLILGDRHYEFLAFGNSQFREHGLCAFASIKGLAEIPDMTADDIRSQLGNFDHIRVPAKWCARLGQNFSTTRAFPTAVTLKGRIPDIERNGYNFSDGVGKMSSFVASMVGMEFGRLPDNPPSAVQFRLGGCKGILTMSPDLPSREIQIRDSQYKFESPNTGLEIIRVSQFVSATLNRQLIVLLSSLKVKDEVFTRMMRGMLTDLETAMVDGDVACRILTKHIDFNHMTLTMVKMIYDGFMDSKEPFLISLLQLWRSWLIKNLKDKARIFVDKGACLFGAVDEYAVLKGHFEKKSPAKTTLTSSMEDLPEVFVQIDADRNGQYRVLEGICMIARNPSLHPGDIRVVRAVDKPQLRHIKDVLVLPQTGDRDLGSMCSGGDLDGDDYLVIWDQSLLPLREQWNHIPMDFSPHPPQPLDRPVTADDISDFFVQYIKNDQLPTIALAHLCWADRSASGVHDPKCLKLAQLHSHAVDYPKNGVPAQVTRDLRPDKWPHFMESKHRSAESIYTSKAVLGQLFDMVERVSFVPALDKPFDGRILGAFPATAALMIKAAEIKQEYDTAIRRIMAQLNIATEFEVFTAFVMNFNREKKEYTLAEELGAITQTHKNRFREMCAQAAGGRTYNDLGPFLVAMYKVTEEELMASSVNLAEIGSLETESDSTDHLPLISFPWIFGAELGNIATGRYRGEDVISVMMTAQHHSNRSKRKQGAAFKYSANGPLLDLSEQLDIPVQHASFGQDDMFTVDDFIGSDPPSLSASQELSVLCSTGDLNASIYGSTPDLADNVNRLRAASVSRSESPMSLHHSESTARESTPPSSQGGREDMDDKYEEEEDEEDVYVDDDIHVDGGLTDRLAALLDR